MPKLEEIPMYYFSCPCCKSNETFYQVRCEPDAPRLGVGLRILGGILASLLMLDCDHRILVQCGHCRYVFRRPPIGRSPAATATLVMFYGLIAAALCGLAVEHELGGLMLIPGSEYLLVFRDFLVAHADGFAAGIAAAAVVVTLLTFAIGLIGNWRHRRRVRTEYEYQPSEYAPAAVDRAPSAAHGCPSCGYDLRGNVTGACPECGRRR